MFSVKETKQLIHELWTSISQIKKTSKLIGPPEKCKPFKVNPTM